MSYNLLMAGFAFRKNLDGSNQAPTNLAVIGANSVVIQKGDLVRVNTSGFVALVAAGQDVAGVVVSVVTPNDTGVKPDANTNDTWTLASNNQTVAQNKVKFIPALPNYLWYNDADGSLTQAMILKHFNVNDENDVAVSTAADAPAGVVVRLIEIDPDGDGDASKGIFQLIQLQLGSNTPAGRET